MMPFEIILICTALALFLLFIQVTRRHHQNQGLGAIPLVQPSLPYFGNALHFNMAKSHLILSELKQKYGAVFRIRLFKEDIVVLNDFASIHDALIVKGSDFAGRPSMYRTSHADRNKHSIVWQTYTQKLMYLRKSVQKCLRMHGAGLLRLEERCSVDITHMCQRLAATKGKAFDPWNIVYDSVCSVMLCLTLGSRLDYNNHSFQKIKEINALFNNTFGSGSARRLDFIPLLRNFGDHSYCLMQEALKRRDEMWEEQLFKLKEGKADSDCVVQYLLDQINSNDKDLNSKEGVTSPSELFTTTNSDSHPDMSITTVKEVFTNLILAGTDTTATALTCLMLVLLHKPNVQQKMQEEVEQVVGHTRSPSLADRPFLPYVEAVLMELLRYISHVPLAVPHLTTCDTSVSDKRVPANTTVYINLWSLHHDEAAWTEPWEFDPSRFLDSQGHLVPPCHENRRKLLPFGAGRRVCLGEVLAKNRLFLFATSMVQRFHFEAEDKDHLPDIDPRNYEMGLVLHPKPFKLCAKLRYPLPGVHS